MIHHSSKHWAAAVAGAMLLVGTAFWSSEAAAFTNDIEIYVTKSRLWQCGRGWDPAHTGRWSHKTGKVSVNGQVVRRFDLSDSRECDTVIRYRVDAGDKHKIVVQVTFDDDPKGGMSAPLLTVAADRVWGFGFFNDSIDPVVISTNWQTPTAGGAPSDRGTNVALDKPASADRSYGQHGPAHATDGKASTIWNGGAHTACLTVDLQAVYAVVSIGISSNQFGASGLRTVFQVSGSLGGGAWTKIGDPITATGDHHFDIPARGTKMRYIRYCTIEGSTNWATLGELSAFGSRAD